MNAQPEALRIANALNREWHNDALNYDTALAAADELRRLHAENETLKETLQRGREVWIASAEAWSRDVAEKDALLRQALEALETDDWQKKLQAAIDIRNHTSPKGATQ